MGGNVLLLQTINFQNTFVIFLFSNKPVFHYKPGFDSWLSLCIGNKKGDGMSNISLIET